MQAKIEQRCHFGDYPVVDFHANYRLLCSSTIKARNLMDNIFRVVDIS